MEKVKFSKNEESVELPRGGGGINPPALGYRKSSEEKIDLSITSEESLNYLYVIQEVVFKLFFHSL